MITISATLHCVECPAKAHNTQLIVRSSGNFEVAPGTLDGWLMDYHDEAMFSSDKPFAGVEPVITCSDDCRKVRDARKRLERSKISEPDQPMTAVQSLPTPKRSTIWKGGPTRPGSFPKVGSKSKR